MQFHVLWAWILNPKIFSLSDAIGNEQSIRVRGDWFDGLVLRISLLQVFGKWRDKKTTSPWINSQSVFLIDCGWLREVALMSTKRDIANS